LANAAGHGGAWKKADDMVQLTTSKVSFAPQRCSISS
jgi:hypothetical protein